ncbi:trafficking protein particle complex subunit 1 [Anaeramoeba ignava]|uniref:Trafficking protein particle complex subunit n=1 Tax=Anaeramoeba ignava TaxID=1746090 RepID=A0A9Q0R8E8_ANAIG|nr:trafficking protein particle complex subunit 1 [Anaeramoeba ignava]
MIYNLFIFSKDNKCLYYYEWNRPLKADSLDYEKENLSGLLIAICDFVSKISPIKPSFFKSYSTSSYKLHYYESLSGFRMAILTDPTTGDLTDSLEYIYGELFTNYVMKNPLYEIGQEIKSQKFIYELDLYISKLPFFK